MLDLFQIVDAGFDRAEREGEPAVLWRHPVPTAARPRSRKRACASARPATASTAAATCTRRR